MQAFISAFARYLQTGEAEDIAAFCQDPSQQPLLAIYRNGFYKSCIDALRANFPVCALFLGDEQFKSAARAYVERYPPKQGTLLGYGDHFAEFLRAPGGQEPEAWQHKRSAAADIAVLDLAWLASLMSANSQHPLAVEHIAQLTEQGEDIASALVNLNPSVRICAIGHQVFEHWVALKTENHNQDEPPAAITAQAQTVMFWRLQGRVQARALSAPEQALMRELVHSGSQLSSALDAALTIDPSFDVSDAFSACLQNKLLEHQPPQQPQPEKDPT